MNFQSIHLMRKLLFNLHLYVALIAGAFVIVLGITGAIMAFEPELDHLLHSRRSYVSPAGQVRTLAELGEIVERNFPGHRIEGYVLSADPRISWQVLLDDRAVFMNPYSGEVIAVYPFQREFLDYVHQLHLRLLWQGRDSPGEKIIAWSGVAMLLLMLSGLYLWWPLKLFSIASGSTGRRWWLDLHAMAGIFSFIFLLLLSFTGVMIGFEDRTEPLMYKLTGSQRSPQPKIPSPPQGGTPIGPDEALEIAAQAVPGAFPFGLFVPGPKGAYQVRLRFPEDRTPGGRSRVIVDQYTRQVLFAEGSRTAPAGSRLVTLNRAIHTGDIFGIPSKFLMSLASLMAALQMVSGAVMWWKRLLAKRRVRGEERQREPVGIV